MDAAKLVPMRNQRQNRLLQCIGHIRPRLAKPGNEIDLQRTAIACMRRDVEPCRVRRRLQMQIVPGKPCRDSPT